MKWPTRHPELPSPDWDETSQVQDGVYMTVIFDNNPDTEFFVESNMFPNLRNDSYDLLSMLYEAIGNYRDTGFWNADEDHYWLGFKNGNVVYIGDGMDPDYKIRLNLLDEKHLQFITVSGSWGDAFWVNGWDGLYALQELTNWFAIRSMEDLLTDWV